MKKSGSKKKMAGNFSRSLHTMCWRLSGATCHYCCSCAVATAASVQLSHWKMQGCSVSPNTRFKFVCSASRLILRPRLGRLNFSMLVFLIRLFLSSSIFVSMCLVAVFDLLRF